MDDTMMQLVLLGELVVKQLEDIKENRTRGEVAALTPYIKHLSQTYQYGIPALYLESTLFNFSSTLLRKISMNMNNPVKDGIEAQQRLQQIYNLTRPMIDYLDSNMTIAEKDKEVYKSLTPKDLIDDLKKLDDNLKQFLEMRPSIHVATSKSEAKEMGEQLIRKAEEAGLPAEEVSRMKKQLAEALGE